MRQTSITMTKNLKIKVSIKFWKKRWGYIPFYPFLPLLGCPTGDVLAAIACGHLEAMVLSQNATVQGFDLDVRSRQVDRMHAGWTWQQRLVWPRCADSGAYDGPEIEEKSTNVWQHVENSLFFFLQALMVVRNHTHWATAISFHCLTMSTLSVSVGLFCNMHLFQYRESPTSDTKPESTTASELAPCEHFGKL